MINCAADILKSEFNKRVETNHRYSARAFAKDMGVSAPMVKYLFNKERTLTKPTAIKISRKLGLSEREHNLFLSFVTVEGKSSAEEKADASNRIAKLLSFKPKKEFSEDEQNLLSHWTHYGILCAMEISDYDGSAKFIAERLNLSEDKVEKSFETFIKLGLVTIRGGRFVVVEEDSKTTIDIPSDALKKTHESYIDQAKKSIRKVSVDKRDISFITMTIDPGKMQEAKEKIKNFRREMCRFLESGEKKEVYTLSMQLFPLESFK